MTLLLWFHVFWLRLRQAYAWRNMKDCRSAGYEDLATAYQRHAEHLTEQIARALYGGPT